MYSSFPQLDLRVALGRVWAKCCEGREKEGGMGGGGGNNEVALLLLPAGALTVQ